MLEDYLSKLGKKVEITVYSDDTIEGTPTLALVYDECHKRQVNIKAT